MAGDGDECTASLGSSDESGSGLGSGGDSDSGGSVSGDSDGLDGGGGGGGGGGPLARHLASYTCGRTDVTGAVTGAAQDAVCR